MMYNFKKLKSIFDKISYSNSEFTSFSDILDYSLIAFRFYETNEELKAAHSILTLNPKATLYNEFLIELTDLNPEGFADPLGEFYMEHISHGRLGQYFTPEPISEMMSLLTGEYETGQKILDPACGSGRFILSAAKRNRHLLFYAADLDPICCKMTLLNMLLNSLTGEVANLNSLSNEFFKGYKVETRLVNGFHYPYFKEFTDPEQSYICLQPQPMKRQALTVQDQLKPAERKQQVFHQGSLF